MSLKKLIAGLGIALSLFGALMLLRVFLPFQALNQTLSHPLYQERELRDDIIIVTIDNQTYSSIEEGGLGESTTWNRTYFAELVSQLQEDNPSAIFFDILFTAESNGIRSQTLLDIAEEYPYVDDFSAEVVNYLRSPHPYDAEFAEALALKNNVYFGVEARGQGEWNGEAIEFAYSNPVPGFIQEHANPVYINVVTSQDSQNSNVIYSIPYQISVGGAVEEHADFQLYREHTGELGALDLPLTKGQFYVNYAGEPFSFPMISFADVYWGRVPEGTFEDKIVLVGVNLAGQDQVFTPIDRSTPMAGVEVHANALQTLLEGKYLAPQSAASLALSLALLVLVSVGLYLWLPVWGGALLILAELIGFPFYAQWLFNRGVIPDLIWPVISMLAAFLATLLYRNITEFREKRKLTRAFSHYVSPDLVKQIASHPKSLKLGGERREISVLFLDLENFTSLSEQLEAQQVVQIINRYFDGLAQVILEHGGTVDKFEGDAIMALFGAPVAQEKHAEAACKAALALLAKLKELNEESGQSLNLRIGLASGEAIVGNMGSEQRFDYTAMGDTVNTASRLESGNKFYGTRILVNPAAFEANQELFSFRRVDRVRLKGKQQAIDVYELLGHKAELSLEGANVIEEWNQALEYYRNQDWSEAEARIQKILEAMPEDGPSKAYIDRITKLKLEDPGAGWDGTWQHEAK